VATVGLTLAWLGLAEVDDGDGATLTAVGLAEIIGEPVGAIALEPAELGVGVASELDGPLVTGTVELREAVGCGLVETVG